MWLTQRRYIVTVLSERCFAVRPAQAEPAASMPTAVTTMIFLWEVVLIFFGGLI